MNLLWKDQEIRSQIKQNLPQIHQTIKSSQLKSLCKEYFQVKKTRHISYSMILNSINQLSEKNLKIKDCITEILQDYQKLGSDNIKTIRDFQKLNPKTAQKLESFQGLDKESIRIGQEIFSDNQNIFKRLNTLISLQSFIEKFTDQDIEKILNILKDIKISTQDLESEIINSFDCIHQSIHQMQQIKLNKPQNLSEYILESIKEIGKNAKYFGY